MKEEDAIRQKPFPSWVWDEEIGYWTTPVPLVNDDKNQAYEWDEETLSWYKFPITGSI
jgi:hypothetical protein